MPSRIVLIAAAVALALLGLGAAVTLRPGESPASAPAGADTIAVPSGQAVTFQDVVRDTAGPAGLTIRFRFLAPAIAPGGGVTFEAAAADMAHLCQTYALPRIAEFGPTPAQIIISLSDVAVPFGQAAPDATQYFEAYTPQGDTCIWEPF